MASQFHQSPTPTTPLTFPNFSQLPPELRIKIWDYVQTFNINRIVIIAYSPQTKSFTSRTKVPPTLHASHESRSLAREIYTLSFATPDCKVPNIYYSPSLDGLTFNWSIYRRNVENMLSSQREVVQCVIIKHSELLRPGQQQLWKFRGLKKVFVDCDGELEERQNYGRGSQINVFCHELRVGEDPEMECSRGLHPQDLTLSCSRHWWFRWWNQRVLGTWQEGVEVEEREKEEDERGWEVRLGRCLRIVERDENSAREDRCVVPLAEQYAAVWHDDASIRRHLSG